MICPSYLQKRCRFLDTSRHYLITVLLTLCNFDEVRTACWPKLYTHTARLPENAENVQNLLALQKRCRFLDTSRHYLITVLLTLCNFDEVRTACRPKLYTHTARLPENAGNVQKLPLLQKRCRFLDTSHHYLITQALFY